MSNDSTNGSVRDALLAELDEVQSVDALLALLRKIGQCGEAITAEESADLARDTLARVSSLTAETPETAAGIIREHLLPWCLRAEHIPGDSKSSGVDGYPFRELLKRWIYAYPQHQMIELRSRILADVLEQLKTAPTRELLWVLSAIGYGAPEVTQVVWPLLSRKDELSDRALGTLAGLGVAPDERDQFLDIVRGRIASGELTSGLLIAVQELVGPHRIELALDLLKLAVTKHPSEKHHDFALAVSTATRAVDRCKENASAHDDMWAILRNHFKTLQMSDEYACRCNTKATVIDYVDWLLTKEVGNDRATGTYIMLSRLGELTKPNQLAGWNEAVTPELVTFLGQVACQDTGMTGQYVTTRMRLKTEAWKTALSIACPQMEEWIDAAIMDESNPYAAHDVAEIVSCLSVRRLPKRLLDAVVASEKLDDDRGHLFRQTGLIGVARSSCNREAFEALLRFGFTHQGNVLLSTIDALAEVAIARIHAGDADIVEKLLEMTTSDQAKRHREAAITVFCRLCSRGLVHERHIGRLREFANGDEFDHYLRCVAMEAIGLIESAQSDGWRDWIRSIARADESDLGWRSCEVLVRRNWLVTDDEPWFFDRLNLTANESVVQVRDAANLNGWQGFLVGLLFRNDMDRFGPAVSGALLQAPTDVVYQVLDSLKHHGNDCPESVADALRLRVHSTNNKASTDTEFFHVLAAVAPSKLLKLIQGSKWSEWLVEARTALCEAIRAAGIERDDHRIVVVECLTQFMRDASFQVRRSAYRATASLAPDHLGSICRTWSRSANIELRKRAAEAAAWLPIDSYPDDALSEFGFSWDVERVVREIWTTVLSDRRQRHWANQYLDRVLASCRGDAETILPEYRYGRALTGIGDDDSVRRIESFMATGDVRPHVRHWLEKMCKEIRKNWKKTTDKWSGPWSHELGRIERLDGEIILGDGTRRTAKLSLWCRYRFGPSDLSEWGGAAEPFQAKGLWGAVRGPTEIQIPGRPPATANVLASSWSSISEPRLTFSGTGPYPAAPHPKEPEGQRSLGDGISEILRECGLELSTQDAEELIEVLERTETSLFNIIPEFDAVARTKIACQESAFVTRAIGDTIPRTYETSVALCRIANFILDREELCLRLSPHEVELFGHIARRGERGSPDELLFWMMDRVESKEGSKPTRPSDQAKRE
ncbi:MAG: hypothetical protein HQ582_24795 [Planctomycetes bacterium]|nr:hypothetical protein [Planctomycetota bacterium]